MQTRRWRVALGVLIVSAAVVAGGCRRRTIWSGIQAQPSSGTIQLAAQEPLCGCTTVANLSKSELRLRAEFRGSTIGSATLQPNQRLRFRFDWAGPENDDVYVLEGTVNGQPVDLTKVLRVEEKPRWQNCNEVACTYGTLLMNLGETSR